MLGKKSDTVIVNFDINPLDVEALERKKTHHKKYVEFLRASHATRVQKQQIAAKPVESELDREMGLEYSTDSETPRLHLPKLVDSYFTTYKAMLEKVKIKKLKTKDMTLDENHFIKKKFKPKPSSQSEIRECKAKLSRADLFQNVTAGNKMFDFGKILFRFTNYLTIHRNCLCVQC